VGYWPSSLFTHLASHGRADMVQFGDEAVNTWQFGSHMPMQMGSGRFPGKGTATPLMRTVLIYRSPTSWEPQEEGMMSTVAVFPQ
jgi:hypothetical protein